MFAQWKSHTVLCFLRVYWYSWCSVLRVCIYVCVCEWVWFKRMWHCEVLCKCFLWLRWDLASNKDIRDCHHPTAALQFCGFFHTRLAALSLLPLLSMARSNWVKDPGGVPWCFKWQQFLICRGQRSWLGPHLSSGQFSLELLCEYRQIWGLISVPSGNT